MFVSVVIVRGILAELQNRGFAYDKALSLLELSSDTVSDIRSRLSFAELDRVVVRAVEASSEPALGLALGMNAPEHMLQLLGHLLLSCLTLRQAFTLFEHFMPLLVDGVQYELSEDHELARFDYHCPIDLDATSRFAAEYCFVMVQRLAGQFVSHPQSRPSAVHFEHARPSYHARYAAAFACPVLFEQPVNRMIFPRWLLDAPQAHADPAVHAGLRELAERMLVEMEQPVGISTRVRDLLRYHAQLAHVDAAKLSRQVGLTPRSLRRRLAAEGLSLSSLVDEARFKLACEGLERNGSIKEIAERLGFSEPSAFHRAFKRWTGVTPLEYTRRSQHAS